MPQGLQKHKPRSAIPPVCLCLERKTSLSLLKIPSGLQVDWRYYSEYDRRTECGETAHPGPYGECRATGIPAVEAVGIDSAHPKG
jgi:hypothetical protein